MSSWNDFRREVCKRIPGRCNKCGLKMKKSVVIDSNSSIETARRTPKVYCSNCGYYRELRISYVAM